MTRMCCILLGSRTAGGRLYKQLTAFTCRSHDLSWNVRTPAKKVDSNISLIVYPSFACFHPPKILKGPTPAGNPSFRASKGPCQNSPRDPKGASKEPKHPGPWWAPPLCSLGHGGAFPQALVGPSPGALVELSHELWRGRSLAPWWSSPLGPGGSLPWVLPWALVGPSPELQRGPPLRPGGPCKGPGSWGGLQIRKKLYFHCRMKCAISK